MDLPQPSLVGVLSFISGWLLGGIIYRFIKNKVKNRPINQRVILITNGKVMNIQEARLKLVQQSIDKNIPAELIPKIVEPLAQYICKGVYLKDSPPKKP